MLVGNFADCTGLFITKLIVPIVSLLHSSLPDISSGIVLEAVITLQKDTSTNSDGYYFLKGEIYVVFFMILVAVRLTVFAWSINETINGLYFYWSFVEYQSLKGHYTDHVCVWGNGLLLPSHSPFRNSTCSDTDVLSRQEVGLRGPVQGHVDMLTGKTRNWTCVWPWNGVIAATDLYIFQIS